MKPSEDIKPVTYMKTRSADLIGSVNKTGRPMIITQNGQAKVVVLDIKRYERDQRALLLLKILSQGAADLDKGLSDSQDVFFKRIEKRLKSAVQKAKRKNA